MFESHNNLRCPEDNCNSQAPRNSVSGGGGGGLNTDCEDINDCRLIVQAKGGASAIMSGYLVPLFVFLALTGAL